MLLTISWSSAQMHEIGLSFGGTNYLGEIGNTAYINPNDLCVGIVYKRNFTTRYSVRAELGLVNIKGDDLDASDPARKTRGLNFENTLLKAGVGFEFNYFDFDLSRFGSNWTPYLHTGISFMRFQKQSYDRFGISKTAESTSSARAISIPMTLGVKYRFTTSLILAAELTANITNTDALDGAYGGVSENESQLSRILTRDWVIFTGFTLTYSFGRPPCYCD